MTVLPQPFEFMAFPSASDKEENTKAILKKKASTAEAEEKDEEARGSQDKEKDKEARGSHDARGEEARSAQKIPPGVTDGDLNDLLILVPAKARTEWEQRVIELLIDTKNFQSTNSIHE